MMRNALHSLALGLLMLVTGAAFAQDTTALRYAAFSDGGELILFKNDSTNAYYAPLNANASFNALFHHPIDGDLYCLHDTAVGEGHRDIYKIDPFSGTMNLVHSTAAMFLAAATVGPNGIVYAVTGHGQGAPGNIYAIDITNGTESLFATVDVTLGGVHQSGANIHYNAATDELWLLVSSADSIIKIDMATQTATVSYLNCAADGGIKGTYLDGNVMWLASDFSYTLDVNALDTVRPSTFVLPDYITDLEKLDLVAADDTIAICGGDSALLHSRFRFDDYVWYLNGNLLGSQNRDFYVTTPGTYQLLARYDNANLDIWSEVIEVVSASGVTAGFGASTITTMVGQPVTFSDSSLGANVYHYDFGDGGVSANANPTHTYTTPGVYIVMQVVSDGLCTDTAYVTITVGGVSVDPAAANGFALLPCVPNPTSGATTVRFALAATAPVTVEVMDLRGAVLARQDLGVVAAGEHAERLDGTADLAAGSYLVRVTTALGVKTTRLMVSR